MSRPKPTVLKSIIAKDNTQWDITEADSQFVITYQGRPCGIRQHVQTLTKQGFKYQKLSYTGLGSARAQVKKLNHKFNTQDFDVMQVCVE